MGTLQDLEWEVQGIMMITIRISIHIYRIARCFRIADISKFEVAIKPQRTVKQLKDGDGAIEQIQKGPKLEKRTSEKT